MNNVMTPAQVERRRKIDLRTANDLADGLARAADCGLKIAERPRIFNPRCALSRFQLRLLAASNALYEVTRS